MVMDDLRGKLLGGIGNGCSIVGGQLGADNDWSVLLFTGEVDAHAAPSASWRGVYVVGSEVNGGMIPAGPCFSAVDPLGFIVYSSPPLSCLCRIREGRGAGKLPRARFLGFVMLTAFVWLQACGQANAPVERQEQKEGAEPIKKEVLQAALPSYDVTANQECSTESYQAWCLSVTTRETSEVPLTDLTRHFRDEYPEYAAVLVTFYSDKPTAEPTGSGLAFRDEEAARAVLSSMYTIPPEASVDEQVRKTMQNDGILVLSLADAEEEMNREVCEQWDTELAGTPPPEMNCPGY
jgi:hypothetical protein